jgi:hypothetical protein
MSGLHELQPLVLCGRRKRRKISSEDLFLRLVSLRRVPPTRTSSVSNDRKRNAVRAPLARCTGRKNHAQLSDRGPVR